MRYWLDLYKSGWRLARLDAEGTLDEAIETAMDAMQTHGAQSARLVNQEDSRVIWRGYPLSGPKR